MAESVRCGMVREKSAMCGRMSFITLASEQPAGVHEDACILRSLCCYAPRSRIAYIVDNQKLTHLGKDYDLVADVSSPEDISWRTMYLVRTKTLPARQPNMLLCNEAYACSLYTRRSRCQTTGT
jgi:hypothetical protein